MMETAATGVDPLTGRKVSDWHRWMLGGSLRTSSLIAGYYSVNPITLNQVKDKVPEKAGKVDVPKNPLKDIKYTDKVKSQVKQGDYHAFPESMDAFGADGKISTLVGGDGVKRTKIEIEGVYGSKKGIFEYIIEPDGTTVNHRLFKPF